MGVEVTATCQNFHFAKQRMVSTYVWFITFMYSTTPIHSVAKCLCYDMVIFDYSSTFALTSELDSVKIATTCLCTSVLIDWVVCQPLIYELVSCAGVSRQTCSGQVHVIPFEDILKFQLEGGPL